MESRLSLRLTDAVRRGLASAAPWLIWAFAIAAITFIACKKCGGLLRNWQEEDLDTLSKMESCLSVALISASVMMILGFFLLAAQLTLIDLIDVRVPGWSAAEGNKSMEDETCLQFIYACCRSFSFYTFVAGSSAFK